MPVVQHPKYLKSAYREEALIQDQKLQCCPANGWDTDKCMQFAGSESGPMAGRNGRDRRFAWRDAKWPWS